jgi:hypothetical protein
VLPPKRGPSDPAESVRMARASAKDAASLGTSTSSRGWGQMRGPQGAQTWPPGLTALSNNGKNKTKRKKEKGCRDSEKTKKATEPLMAACLSLGMACNIKQRKRQDTDKGGWGGVGMVSDGRIWEAVTVCTPLSVSALTRPCMHEERGQ